MILFSQLVEQGDREKFVSRRADVWRPRTSSTTACTHGAFARPSLVCTQMTSPSFLQECRALYSKRFSYESPPSITETELPPVVSQTIRLPLLSSIDPSSQQGISKDETTFYYSGVSPSPPRIIYRSSTTPFVMPTEPEAYRRLKELYPVFDLEFIKKWNYLGPQVPRILDEHQVAFTSVDVVRFLSEEVPNKRIPAFLSPIVVWIGVYPGMLAYDVARAPANAILELLKAEGITTVDVEFRESVFKRSAGVPLYEPAAECEVQRYIMNPLTTALCVPVSSAATPHSKGMIGFYFKHGEDLYGVTARHVLFPKSEDDNSEYVYDPDSGPRKDVLLMNTIAWDEYLKSIKVKIGSYVAAVKRGKRSVTELENMAAGGGFTADDIKTTLISTRKKLIKDTDDLSKLTQFYEQVEKDFNLPDQRMIGHVVWSPAMTQGAAPHSFTADICVVKLNKDKFLPNFEGNVMDLGSVQGTVDFMKMTERLDVQPTYTYPFLRLIVLSDILTYDRMIEPKATLSYNNEKCLYVIKRGRLAANTSIGRASGCFSFVREYFPDNTYQDSREWPIFPNGSESKGSFSESGDSGCLVATGSGEFGGLLVGGCGRKVRSSDITYATPMCWIWPIIEAKFPNASLCPSFV